MLRMSVSKLSGNPAALPSHSRPESEERDALILVGPAAMGVFAPGVESPPDANWAEPESMSVGNMFGSLILPTIHFCTNWMY